MSRPKRTLSPPPDGWTEESEQKRKEDFMRKYPWPEGAYRSTTPAPPREWGSEKERLQYFARRYPPPKHKPSRSITSLSKEGYSLWDDLLRFIDWLNGLLGIDKPKGKRKETDEQMATLADLFDDEKEIPRAYRSRHPGWFSNCECGLLDCVCHLLEQRPEAPPPQPTLGIKK